MIQKKHKYLITLNILFFGILFFIACKNNNSNNQEFTKYSTLENKVNNWVNSEELIGAEILIIEKNKETFHKSFGWADKESNKKLENGSIWTVMSMTKPFTATAILMLIEDGKLSFDDRITKYFPDFNGNPQITIRHLLAQSSGDDGKHGNGGHNVTEFEILDEWINDWSKQKSSGTFGEFAYSNFNYGALAYIVEQVSGKSIETFITERIIQPLNLEDTFVEFSTNSNWAEKVPSRYQWNDSIKGFEEFWTNNKPPSWKFLSGSLGLWMSAKDYAVFMQMWLNKGKHGNLTLLKESTVDEALKIHVNANGEKLFGHGYGWFIEEEPLIFRYGGSAGGFAKACLSKNSIMVYLTHCSGGKHKSRFEDELDKIWFPNDN
ncbi:serine hydrolase [Flavobacteriaceae bacterium KMM 6898]|nr:serine hydrolase [Flavobacteriaceae bacterium KMM 6898]